jgi:hypothetical protein
MDTLMAIVIRYALPGAGTVVYGPVALAARLPETGVALAGRSFIPTPT